MSPAPRYVVVESRPSVIARACEGAGCDTAIYPGDTVCTVLRERRWLDGPGRHRTQAFLCAPCTARLLAHGVARPASAAAMRPGPRSKPGDAF